MNLLNSLNGIISIYVGEYSTRLDSFVSQHMFMCFNTADM